LVKNIIHYQLISSLELHGPTDDSDTHLGHKCLPDVGRRHERIYDGTRNGMKGNCQLRPNILVGVFHVNRLNREHGSDRTTLFGLTKLKQICKEDNSDVRI